MPLALRQSFVMGYISFRFLGWFSSLYSKIGTVPSGKTVQGEIDGILNITNKIKFYSGQAGATVDTGIKVNAGYLGGTVVIIASCHTSSGNSTTSCIFMVRCGYDGGNYAVIEVAKSQVGGAFTVSKNSSNHITISATGAWQAMVLCNKGDLFV